MLCYVGQRLSAIYQLSIAPSLTLALQIFAMAAKSSRATEKYGSIIRQYAGAKKLHPLIQALIDDDGSHSKLVAVIEHDITAIRARSQNLDDYEITAAQKAFVNLIDYSTESAMHIYAEEIMGTKFTPDAEITPIFKHSIDIRATLLGGRWLDFAALSTRSWITKGPASTKSNQPASAATSEPNPSTTTANIHSLDQAPITSRAPVRDKKIERLESLINGTQKEFHDAQEDSYAQRDSAKFLRDTIDNLIEYVGILRATKPTVGELFYEEKLLALQSLREEAINKALQGYNGKPRPFERARKHPRPRPSFKRENAILSSPRGHSRPATNSIRLNHGQAGGQVGGKSVRIDRYRPYRQG